MTHEEAIKDWVRTPKGKLVCPTCGVSGWPDGSWLDLHVQDHPHGCSCGKKYTSKAGLGVHLYYQPSHWKVL